MRMKKTTNCSWQLYTFSHLQSFMRIQAPFTELHRIILMHCYWIKTIQRHLSKQRIIAISRLRSSLMLIKLFWITVHTKQELLKKKPPTQTVGLIGQKRKKLNSCLAYLNLCNMQNQKGLKYFL